MSAEKLFPYFWAGFIHTGLLSIGVLEPHQSIEGRQGRPSR
jgi:hypothetical protein